MRPTLRSFSYALMLLLLATALVAPARAGESAEGRPLRGFVRKIAGEQMDYHCFNPLARAAILTRCTTGEMAIEWETEPIPDTMHAANATFIWVASYSTTTSTADHQFDVFLNGTKAFTFTTRMKQTDSSWVIAGENGATLSFRLVKKDPAGDANGYMELTVPVATYGRGKALTIKVVGHHDRSKDWYMTFLYDMRDRGIEVVAVPFLRQAGPQVQQAVFVGVNYLGHEGNVEVSLDGGPRQTKHLKMGFNDFEFGVPAVDEPRTVAVDVTFEDGKTERATCAVKQVKRRTIYLLPHSHNDIGYTAHQSEVLRKQVQNTRDAMALIRSTAGLPPEARFRWNVEVLWGLEQFLAEARPAEKKEFFDDVKHGTIDLQGLYANMLTGVMRPEELYRMLQFARELRQKYGVTIASAMISDVPGMTWNVIPALARSGIRYFSAGPNGTYKGGDRTGHTNRAWGDRPFYWVSPSGTEKVLYWMTGFGYGSLFAGVSATNTSRLTYLKSFAAYSDWLDTIGYPYEMIQMRHTVGGDNGTVDPDLPGYVKTWNEEHLSPKIVIATTTQLFTAFEQRYGATLPAYQGDLTPYWEDGAASTAAELGMNRAAAERLSQAGALAAILRSRTYDHHAVDAAWKNVLLFDEHTWGAWNSTSDPDSPFVVRQWETKRQFALDADGQSKRIFADVAGTAAVRMLKAFDVVNTHSWARTDIVTIPAGSIREGDVVSDASGTPVLQQSLSNGDRAFHAEDVPPLGARRYTVVPGTMPAARAMTVDGTTIANEALSVTIDPRSGALAHLIDRSTRIDLVDGSASMGLNEYLYVDGFDPKSPGRVIQSTVRVKEHGPLLTSLLVTSPAPGCRILEREVRLIHGSSRADLINTIDKKKVRTGESVHFAFPFNVRAATVRADLGTGIIRPEADQLPGGCRDYLSVQRWVDVADQDHGVLCTVNEAPLVEVGSLHSELPQSSNLDWKKVQASSPTIYSYVMNNYWYTNYKADQEGVSTYRYSLHPHALFNQAEAARRGMERSQPLVLHPVVPGEAPHPSIVTIDPPTVLVSELWPASDGQGTLMRLYNAGGRSEMVRVTPRDRSNAVYVCGPDGEEGEKRSTMVLAPYETVTIRIR